MLTVMLSDDHVRFVFQCRQLMASNSEHGRSSFITTLPEVMKRDRKPKVSMAPGKIYRSGSWDSNY